MTTAGGSDPPAAGRGGTGGGPDASRSDPATETQPAAGTRLPAGTPDASGTHPAAGTHPARAAGAAGAKPGAAGTGILYVVATPIGNLMDVTLRSLEVLRSVAVVAAEDTRLTRRLWARHGIATPLLSYHARSAESRMVELLARLAGGDDVALVTDAGTPLVSDPGGELVRAWSERGGRVVPIPGASAVLAALVASGLPAPRWCFEGFLPRRGADRRERLARIAGDERATVLFEAPGRTAATLRDLAEACGPDREAAICRELTKIYEEILRAPLGQLAAQVAARNLRGEVTIVVAGRRTTTPASGAAAILAAGEPSDSAGRASLAEGRARVEALVAAGQPRSAAARQVARESGLRRRELFVPGESRPSDPPPPGASAGASAGNTAGASAGNTAGASRTDRPASRRAGRT